MFIQHDNAQIFTVSFGNASWTLVALGGWTGSWEVWAAALGHLGQDWRTVAFDHRGTGATIAPPESITVEKMVADLFAVLDAWGIERCVLAAESSGAAVALQAAYERPSRFDGLVLVSGLYYRPYPTTPSPFVQGLHTNYEATVSQFVEWCIPEPESTAVRRWGKQILMRASPEAAIRLYECMDGVDLRPQVSQITTPTLLIHGDADVILPLESSRWLAAHMPTCHLEVFPGAGHAPMMTFPREVAEAINAYFSKWSLGKLEGGGGSSEDLI